MLAYFFHTNTSCFNAIIISNNGFFNNSSMVVKRICLSGYLFFINSCTLLKNILVNIPRHE
ncbi:MAG TPA: hypothetical protein DEQ77_05370 [Candidatus Omnitrophica bacterium]|nr:hypothetical protein [Candidatus Omnitrophota bacterium]